jgi:N-acetylmuramoyl-L-alanine amidase
MFSVMLASALMCSSALASNEYPFRSRNAVLTVINTADLTANDVTQLTCMARNIYHEARGQSMSNQRAVAWVTRNRSRLTGRSICDVVFESRMVRGRRIGQFSWTVLRHTRLMEKPAWDQAQRIAQEVITSPLSRDFTRGATHFHESTISPSWSRAGRNRRTIGAHTFMTLPQYASR